MGRDKQRDWRATCCSATCCAAIAFTWWAAVARDSCIWSMYWQFLGLVLFKANCSWQPVPRGNFKFKFKLPPGLAAVACLLWAACHRVNAPVLFLCFYFAVRLSRCSRAACRVPQLYRKTLFLWNTCGEHNLERNQWVLWSEFWEKMVSLSLGYNCIWPILYVCAICKWLYTYMYFSCITYSLMIYASYPSVKPALGEK